MKPEPVKISATCKDCSHYEGCSSPCIFVQEILGENKPFVREKMVEGVDGKPVVVFWGESRVINETQTMKASKRFGQRYKENRLFETKDSPWKQFEPSLIQTGIFIDRFFNKWSYEDLAVKYGITVHNVHGKYSKAVQLLFKILAEMDSGKKRVLKETKKRIEKRSGSIPDNQRWFLMNKVFGLIPTEIMEYEGLSSPRPIAHAIQTVGDRIAAGELEIFKPDAETMQAAKARLEAKRAKARAYQKKKDPEKVRAATRKYHEKNREKINTRQRELRADKKQPHSLLRVAKSVDKLELCGKVAN